MVFLENPSVELDYEGVKIQLRFNKKDAVDVVDAFGDIRLGEDYELIVRKKSGKRSLNANNFARRWPRSCV